MSSQPSPTRYQDVSSSDDAAVSAPPAQEPTAATELVAAARRLAEAAGTTAVDDAELRRATAELDALTERLSARRRERMRRDEFTRFADARAAGPDCELVTSRHNPTAPPLRLWFDGDEVRGRLQAGALHEGPPDSVHGGWIGWLVDTVLGALVQSRGRPAVTGSLDIRYRQRTPLDTPLDLGARLRRQTGRKLLVDGWIDVEGVRTVEASGLFIELR